MRCLVLCTVLAVLVPAGQARAWNRTGHMTVALLAYRSLKAPARARAEELLKKHPHYQEFLIAEKPGNVTEGEWAFLRAAGWPDWVRSGPPERTKFNVPDRHFLDKPFVKPGDEGKVTIEAEKPENALVGLKRCMEFLQDESKPAEERAIQLCWLLHLVGDVHQPLHCSTFYSAQFSNGDRGGNSFLVGDHGGHTVKLHHLWDELLGPESQATYSALELIATDIEHAPELQRDKLAALVARDGFADWIDDSAALARDIGYMKGRLRGASSHHGHDEGQIRVPALPDRYERLAHQVARKQAALAGFRLSDKLNKIFGG